MKKFTLDRSSTKLQGKLESKVTNDYFETAGK
jgi:hypothetical protein